MEEFFFLFIIGKVFNKIAIFFERGKNSPRKNKDLDSSDKKWFNYQFLHYQTKNYFLVELNKFSLALHFLLNFLSVSSEYLTELYDLGAETSYHECESVIKTKQNYILKNLFHFWRYNIHFLYFTFALAKKENYSYFD